MPDVAVDTALKHPTATPVGSFGPFSTSETSAVDTALKHPTAEVAREKSEGTDSSKLPFSTSEAFTSDTALKHPDIDTNA